MASTYLAVLAGWLTLAAASANGDGAADQELRQAAPGPIVDTRPVTKDCMVLSYMPEWNHGNVDNVAVANNEGGVRSLFAWKAIPADLISPKGRRVFLAVYSRKTTAAATGGEIAVHRLLEGWPERTSWQSQPKIDESTTQEPVKFTEGDGWKLFDVTPLVAERKARHGVVLKFTDETRSGQPGHWSGYAFVSREGDGQWQQRQPRLLIVDASPSAARSENTQAWVERLMGLRDHMHTAFGVGPDLTLLDPDEGLQIVREAWPQIRVYEVKTGLLKTFAFSKALEEKHPHVLQVLHLGMTDRDPKVREYAASYLEDYSTIDFKRHPKRYEAWYRQYGDTPPEELLQSKQPANAKPSSPPPTGDVADLSQLDKQGWQRFFSGDYSGAEQNFRQILATDAGHLAAINGLGFTLLNQGKVEEAETYFDKYLAVEPDAPGPLNGKARCLMAGGKTDEAIEVWLRAHEISPEPNDITAGLARAYIKRGDHAKAIPLLEEWVEKDPDNARIRRMLETAREGANE